VGGAEALLRWEHPELGTISPLEFIPLAEESGLIVPIGRWVLESACRQAQAWQGTLTGRAGLSIAVNVSGRQLQEPGFVDEVRGVLDRSGLPPETLTLEITESVLVQDSESLIGSLRSLRRLGIRIAVDDFGTGYSSLAYLRRFPVDILKIDRCFTSMIERVDFVPPLVEGLVHLGHQLGLEIVAEGVEMPEQRGQLRSLGCGLGQGFLWARPLDPGAFEAFYAIAPPVPVSGLVSR
jgi:EAL domain-containing protein (putative c-di-GMP-specific phosphodiesterase class I)